MTDTREWLQWIAPDGSTLEFTTVGSPPYKFLKTYDGFSSLPVTHESFTSPYLDGAIPVNSKFNPRVLSFDIDINTYNLGLQKGQVRELNRCLNPKGGDGTLIYHLADGSVRAITCRINNNTPTLSKTQRNPQWQRAYLEFIAHNPFFYDPTPVTEPLASFTGGLTDPIVFPMNFGTANNQATITNLGNVDTPCFLTFHGAITDPHLDNVTTGEYIELDLTIADGETVTVKTGPGSPTIRYLHGSTDENGFKYVVPGSTTIMKIIPGENLLDFSASASVGAAAYCEIKFYPYFSGV